MEKFKIKITRGSVLTGTGKERKEYTEESGVIDVDKSMLESLKKSQNCDFEEIKDHFSDVDGGPNEGTVRWYRQELDRLGIDFDRDARKDALVELHFQATAGQ